MRKLNKAPSAYSLIIFPTPGGGRDPFLPSPLRRARPTLDPPDVAVVGALGLLCPRPAVGVEPLPHAPYDVFFVCPRLPRSRRIREGSRGGGGGSNDCSSPPPPAPPTPSSAAGGAMPSSSPTLSPLAPRMCLRSAVASRGLMLCAAANVIPPPPPSSSDRRVSFSISPRAGGGGRCLAPAAASPPVRTGRVLVLSFLGDL